MITTETTHFDLQKALAFPKLSTSVVYYKVNLYLYDFGILCLIITTVSVSVYRQRQGQEAHQRIGLTSKST